MDSTTKAKASTLGRGFIVTGISEASVAHFFPLPYERVVHCCPSPCNLWGFPWRTSLPPHHLAWLPVWIWQMKFKNKWHSARLERKLHKTFHTLSVVLLFLLPRENLHSFTWAFGSAAEPHCLSAHTSWGWEITVRFYKSLRLGDHWLLQQSRYTSENQKCRTEAVRDNTRLRVGSRTPAPMRIK